MGYNSKTQTFDTSPELRNREGRNGSSVFVLGYYEAGDFGRTLVYTYNSSSTQDDDGGIVFKPDSIDSGNPGRWLLSYTQPINVLWFGLKAAGTGFDNLSLFNAMIAALPNIPVVPNTTYNLKGSVFFPRNEDVYYFSDTISLTDTIKMIGEDGADFIYGSVLQFPADTTGIHVIPVRTGPVKGAYYFFATDLKIQSSIGTDTTKPGILINRPCYLNNVDVTGFSGGGILVDTTVEGTADLCSMINCSAYYNGESGLMFKGIDSNQSTIILFNSFGNYRWGIDDNSFLGNVFIGCHTNVNSNVPGNPVWAFNNDATYACIQNHTNVEPGVDSGWEAYWILVPNPGVTESSVYFPAWSDSFAYKTGGAYNSYEQAVNAASWLGCYSEGGQAPSALGTYNLRVGGAHGAGFRSPNTMAGLSASLGLVYSEAGFYVRPPIDFNTTAIQELTIDESGFSVFASDEGVRGRSNSLLWDNTLKCFVSMAASTAALSAYWITTPEADRSLYGLTGAVLEGIMAFQRGMYLGIEDNANHFRSFSFSESVPTTGEHAIGDIRLKRVTGAADPIYGWRCTAAGTPGTWEILYAKLTP